MCVRVYVRVCEGVCEGVWVYVRVCVRVCVHTYTCACSEQEWYVLCLHHSVETAC